MSGKLTSILLVVIALACQAFALTDATQFNSQRLNQDRPLFFTENKGQWDERVLFKADGAGGLTWFIEWDGFTVLFSVPDTTAEPIADPRSAGMPEEMRRFDAVDRYPNKAHALKFKFQNALPRSAGNFLPEQSSPATASSIESTERLSWNNNYFLGNDESKWAPECGNFQQVALKDVWTGVDVQWRGVGKAVEFDFVVTPGADANQIRVECLGLTGDLETTTDGGELLLPTSLGVLRQALPEAFQIEPDGSLSAVRAEFAVKGGNSFGVDLPEGHDATKPLVIDPLVYSTYLGGSGDDRVNALASDGAGGVIVTSQTSSNDFPSTEGAFDRSFNGGDYDACVAGLNDGGSELVYSTYLGGNSTDAAYAVSPDSAGGVVVVGYTGSQNFPATDGAYQRNISGGAQYDAFIARLNAQGNALIYSTYLGGDNGSDVALAVTPDGAGGTVVAGYTVSNNFPTTREAYQRNFGSRTDAFITRLNAEGSALIYSTYLGGNGNEYAYAITSDGARGVFVAGNTSNNNFPTTEGAYQRNIGGGVDCFIARLNAAGSELIYSTFLGGGGDDAARALAPDQAGGIVVAGYTDSDDFPTTEGTFDRSFNGGNDCFIARLNAAGSELIYSTFLGGGGDDAVLALAPDWAGGVVVAGMTRSNDFPTIDGAFDRSFNGATDAFVARLRGDGGTLLHSTYLGGGSTESASGLVVDWVGGVVVAGMTNSGNFPITEEAFDSSFNGGSFDAFLARLSGMVFLRWVETPDTLQAEEGDLVEFSISGESSDENAELAITYNSDDLPDSAGFTDHRDGSGAFRWQTTFQDAGRYTALFNLLDGENALEAEVTFFVSNVSRPPSRVQLALPRDHSRIPADTLARFAWSRATDESGDSLTYILKVTGSEHTLSYDAGGDTILMVEQRDLLWLLTGDSLRWEVWAKNREDSTRSETVFTLLPLNHLPSRVLLALPSDHSPIPADSLVQFAWNRATDEDGDTLTYVLKVVGGRDSLSYNSGADTTRMVERRDLLWLMTGDGLRWEVWAKDGIDSTRCDSAFTLLPLNHPPSRVLLAIPSDHSPIRADSLVQFAWNRATDEDGDTLTYVLKVAGGRDSLSFNAGADTTRMVERHDLLWLMTGNGLRWEVWAKDGIDSTRCDSTFTLLPPLGVSNQDKLPSEFSLSTYPNPFNGITTIHYSLPEASVVKLSVFDLTGREIVILALGNLQAGFHSGTWTADRFGSGLYLVRLEAGNKTMTQKVILVK